MPGIEHIANHLEAQRAPMKAALIEWLRIPGALSTEHQPNERVVLAELYRAMEIYAHAIYELTRWQGISGRLAYSQRQGWGKDLSYET